MLFDPTWAVPHVVSLLLATAFLVTAVIKPLRARMWYAGLFAYAALVNTAVTVYKPESYLGNARYVLLDSYRTFILGWFSEHIVLVVASIALCQALICAGLIRGGWVARAALLAAITFFIAIAPLGVASAFPSSLIWAAGAAWLLNHGERTRLSRATLHQPEPV